MAHKLVLDARDGHVHVEAQLHEDRLQVRVRDLQQYRAIATALNAGRICSHIITQCAKISRHFLVSTSPFPLPLLDEQTRTRDRKKASPHRCCSRAPRSPRLHIALNFSLSLDWHFCTVLTVLRKCPSDVILHFSACSSELGKKKISQLCLQLCVKEGRAREAYSLLGARATCACSRESPEYSNWLERIRLVRLHHVAIRDYFVDDTVHLRRW